MRNLTAKLIAPALKLTGYRFPKAWRYEENPVRYWIQSNIISTPLANIIANG